ncbi:Sapep family Mn(2+)-dependent dipeptidase [Lactobacillus sp. LC28-10]|uniref:Sapep family Mn(2+)-dependent dipeptidase n=1 Tax=Secundilactobacillus angelensis TaxID=2722706 RepID=A0ABX1L0P1_9LACO|nr:M20 family metallopeptidase [Secundilactobacillus angelensis]MCH5461799.1 M20 family metallopeptidase [Secundilactobacillus angelensis]NLR18638.1 Sapep family Mn(2+)-dependent dipeptidase [Secundilactobacillus angelensis]
MQTEIKATHQKAAIEALKRLVKHPSSTTDPAPGAPFGQPIRDALDEMMTICDELGFKTYTDPEGHYGYAEVGEGMDIFGILGHVDVVPAGDIADWSYDPFDLTVENGVMYGRGVQDDKGPSVAALYAVKALMDAGVTFKERIRFIFGTDEETLWRGIAVYQKNEEPITHGIAPDSEFPVTYAEKGLQQSYFVGPGSTEFSLKMQNAFNAVPAKAKYNGPKLEAVKPALDAFGFGYETDDEGITVTGKSVHAMLAPEGTNAVLRLAMALDKVFPDGPLGLIGRCFKEDATGANLVGDVADSASGHLTVNISNIEVSPEETRMQVDMRIPVTVDHDELIEKMTQKIDGYGYRYEDFDYLAPLYVPKDSELVEKLMTVYREVTGDTTEPQVSGGATYARTMNQCVAFGAMLPDVTDYMHQVDEQWELEKMFTAMDIYAAAIKAIVSK